MHITTHSQNLKPPVLIIQVLLPVTRPLGTLHGNAPLLRGRCNVILTKSTSDLLRNHSFLLLFYAQLWHNELALENSGIATFRLRITFASKCGLESIIPHTNVRFPTKGRALTRPYTDLHHPTSRGCENNLILTCTTAIYS